MLSIYQERLRALLSKAVGRQIASPAFDKALSKTTGLNESEIVGFLNDEHDLSDVDASQLAELFGYHEGIDTTDASRDRLSLKFQEEFRETLHQLQISGLDPDSPFAVLQRLKRDAQELATPDAESESFDVIRKLLGKNVEIAESIPPQDELVRFIPNEQNQLTLAASPPTGEDADAIATLRQELLAFTDRLTERYANSQSPQAELFRPVLDSYRDELSKPLGEINFLILYTRGSRFNSRKALADKKISESDPEWVGSSFDADENDDIEAIWDTHGLLMMQSPLGRKAVSDAATFRATPAQIDERNKAFKELAEAATSEDNPFDERSHEVISILQEDGDQQPEHLGAVQIAVSGTLLTLLVGVPALFGLGIGAVTAPWLGVLLGAAATRISYEAAKDTKTVKSAKAFVVDEFNKLDDDAQKQAIEKYDQIAEKLSAIRTKFASTLERASDLVPEFSWAKRVLKGSTPELEDSSANLRLLKHVFVVGEQSEVLANQLARQFPGTMSMEVNAILMGKRTKRTRQDAIEAYLNEVDPHIIWASHREVGDIRTFLEENSVFVVVDETEEEGDFIARSSSRSLLISSGLGGAAFVVAAMSDQGFLTTMTPPPEG